MADLLAAADVLDREITRHQGLIEAMKYLRGLGSLEQALADATRRTSDAQATALAAQADLGALLATIEQKKKDAESIISDARDEAQRIKTEAERAAQDAVNKAAQAAEEHLAAAHEEAGRLATLAQERVNATDAQLQSLAARKAELESAITVAQSTHNDLQAKITSARAQIQQLLGQ
jgi:chromosome segregation ATPase